jgi:hypothetical protein
MKRRQFITLLGGAVAAGGARAASRVGSLIPYLRQRSVVFIPASFSLRIAMVVWSFPQGQTLIRPGSIQGGNVRASQSRQIGDRISWGGEARRGGP